MSQNREKKIIIIVPARLNSKRLKIKNILPIKGLPMFVHVVNQARKSIFKPDVYVSTESKKIIDICKKNKILFIKRPKKLSKDNIEKQDVVVHSMKYLQKKNVKSKIVISLQVNTPQVNTKDLDRAINFFCDNSFKNKPIREVISVGKDNLQNGAFRIMTYRTVFQKTLSTKVGIFFTNYIDIHHKKDYSKVLKLMESK
ncbi:hypothetical protein OAI70_01655 [Candidatus Pelagibacter sp.]|nr:hypothetical protein [Candidatus Pelagibacter sp.]